MRILPFPGYDIPFELETDVGICTPFVTSSSAGYTVGDPIAGVIATQGNPILVTNIETDKRFLRKNRLSRE